MAWTLVPSHCLPLRHCSSQFFDASLVFHASLHFCSGTAVHNFLPPSWCFKPSFLPSRSVVKKYSSSSAWSHAPPPFAPRTAEKNGSRHFAWSGATTRIPPPYAFGTRNGNRLPRFSPPSSLPLSPKSTTRTLPRLSRRSSKTVKKSLRRLLPASSPSLQLAHTPRRLTRSRFQPLPHLPSQPPSLTTK